MRKLALLLVWFGSSAVTLFISLSFLIYLTQIQALKSLVHLEVRDNLDGALKAIARFRVVDLRTEQPSLEQIFLAYYQPASQSDVKEAARAAS